MIAASDELPHDALIEGGRIGNGLNNAADVLILINSDGVEQDRVSWGDETTDAPRAGTSLQRDSADAQPTIAEPTPQTINRADAAAAPEPILLTLRISEVMPNPEEGGEEWVELHNFGPEPIDLEGWRLGDSRTQHSLEGTIQPGQRYIKRGRIGNGLNNRGDTVLLTFGEITIDSVEYGTDVIPAPARGRSLARAATWYIADDPTPGEASKEIAPTADEPDPEPEIIERHVPVPFPLTLRITEIMRQAQDSTAWIELHNFGDLNLEPSGWFLGSAHPQLPLADPIPAGEYIVVHDARTALGDEYVSLWYEPTGGEPLLVDSVEYAALPQPQNGVSAALINGRWAALEKPTPGSPGGTVATPAVEPPPEPIVEQPAEDSLNPWLIVSAALMALLAVIIIRLLFPHRPTSDDQDDGMLPNEPPYDGLDQPPLDFDSDEPGDAEPPPGNKPHPWE